MIAPGVRRARRLERGLGRMGQRFSEGAKGGVSYKWLKIKLQNKTESARN